jgi:MFS family permease
VQTVIAMYALVMAAFMVTGAKLADLWGRRRVFTLGALTYGTGAGITALSPSLGVMAFGWSLIEGLGAALVTPAILTLTTGQLRRGGTRTPHGLYHGPCRYGGRMVTAALHLREPVRVD